jgi:anti-anti-sigma factor
LSLELVTRGPVTVIAVSGEVDMSNAHLLTELAEYVVGDRPLRLVLDLAKVTFFCLDGVRVLLGIQRAVTAEAGHLVLRAPSPITLRVLTLTRVLHRFTIHASASAA